MLPLCQSKRIVAAEAYTTQLQAGLGLINETNTLMSLWSPGMSSSELFQTALDSGQFPNVAARRLRNIIAECFRPRYMATDPDVVANLKLLQPVLTRAAFGQLLFLYTCRANAILADFVHEVYWERYAGGYDLVSKQDAADFINRAMDDGKTEKRWAESTVKRMGSYLLGACADYGLLGKRSAEGRKIDSFRIEPNTVAYLAHDLHFQGLGDNTMIAHFDWQLFGLNAADVRDELKSLSRKGFLILQAAGDVTHIGWKHATMKELVNVLIERPA
ncbi:DUF1819 family protein [Gammaproteobacteria bacterium]|nr:DUF1819 family protein [Gammaproteobacteria bacterium]